MGAAAQSAVTRQQMGELLHFASGAPAAENGPLPRSGCAAAGQGAASALHTEPACVKRESTETCYIRCCQHKQKVKQVAGVEDVACRRAQTLTLCASAAGTMREARQERGAEFLELLADNLAAAGAGRGAALVSNIVTGGRQSMTGGSQQLSSAAAMRASLRARVRARPSLRFNA